MTRHAARKNSVKAFGRRATLLIGGNCLAWWSVRRLYYLQVVESQNQKLADDNRINLRLLAPPRGHIVDEHGAPMAVNVQNYRVVLVAERRGYAETLRGWKKLSILRSMTAGA